MRRYSQCLQVSVALLLLAVVLCQQPSVTLDSGLVLKGSQDEEYPIDFFGAVRYAEAPVGDLRWRPSQPYKAKSGEVQDASNFGAICHQDQQFCDAQPLGCSEDCLFLNVYTPSSRNQTSAALPVALWIHGGKFEQGSGNLYKMSSLSSYWEGKAVIVTINYRLGVYGFLGSEKLRSLDPDGSTGNQGLGDQRLAMKWVQQNIQSFGGDPKRVMIFGESAGASSITNHLAAKKSWGLYSRVIMESGSFSYRCTQTLESAEKVFSAFVSSSERCESVPEEEIISCLQSLDAEEISTAMEQAKGGGKIGFAPTADGVELSTHPLILAQNPGNINQVPILHGTNTDEGLLLVSATPGFSKEATEDDLKQWWEKIGFDVPTLSDIYLSEELQATYPVHKGYSMYYFAAERSYGDFWLQCSKKLLSGLRSDVVPVHQYYFDHPIGNNFLVPHAAEIAFVLQSKSTKRMEKDVIASNFVATWWGNFLLSKTGDPNEAVVGIPKEELELVEWSSFNKVTAGEIVIPPEGNPYMQTNTKATECSYWIPYLSALLHTEFRSEQ
eukprot:GSChrysophyteH1.ASY1.ANO1.2572.1 assembled CDS